MSIPLQPRRGFSLIELTVVLALSSVAVTLIAAVMVTQNRSFQSQENMRLAQDASRTVLNVLEPAVRRAGFGINPAFAFDFNVYQAAPCGTSTAACPRDEVNGTDKLVFYARNQRYALSATPTGNIWTFQGTSGGLQLAARAGDVFRKGQILYVVCNAVADSAFVTVGSNVTVQTAGTTSIALDTAVTDQFHQSARFGTNGCYAAGAGTTTMVFLIDRYHFYVANHPNPSGGTTPWLMLDTGRDENGDNRLDLADHLPVAENIEDFQVAYLMNSRVGTAAPDPGNTDGIFGNAGANPEVPNPGIAAPAIDAGMDDAARFTASPANIRGVRVSFTARAPMPGDPASATAVADAPTPLENRTLDSLPATGRFRRVVFSTTIMTPNMESRRLTVF